MSGKALPAGPPSAVLRVYEPLEAFTLAERDHWERYARQLPPSECDAEAQVADGERRACWERVVGVRRRPLAERALARVLRVDDSLLVCPAQMRLRWAAAAGQARRDLPAAIVGAALLGVEQPSHDPGPDHPDPASADGVFGGATGLLRTRSVAWDLPWAWLALFRSDDRRARTCAAGTGDMRYLVPIGRARGRAARALRAVREGLGAGEVAEEFEDLARWLEEFHPRAWVELDASAVTRLIPRESSATLPSPGVGWDGAEAVDDVRLGLECLEAGDGAGLAAAYRRLRRRSDRLHAISRSS